MRRHQTTSSRSDRSWVGYLLLLLSALGWAGAWLTARLAAHDAPPVTVTFGRFAVATAALLPFWFATERRKGLRLTRVEWGIILGMSLTGVIGYTILFLIGVALAPASDGAVITPGLVGAFAMLIALLATGERPARRAVVGVAFAMTGCFLVGWSAIGAVSTDHPRLVGDLIFVVSAAAWGAYTVLGKRLSASVPATTGVLVTSGIGAALLAPVALWVDGVPNLHSWTAAAVFNVLYLGVCATAVAFVTYYLAVKIIGIGRTAPTLGLVPLFGVVGAALLLKERITLLHAWGGILVITGIVLPAIRRHDPR